MTRRLVTVQRRDGQTVRNIEADVCAACGERYFDVAAMRAIET